MKVISYKHVLPTDKGIVETLDRQGYATPQYIDLVYDYIKGIKLEGRCAVLYSAGAAVSASEARNVHGKSTYREEPKESTSVIKELAAYSMHKWIGLLDGKENIEYANINGNTCASSMYSLAEAEELIARGFDKVIIIAEEKTSYNTLRIFDEHSIDLKVGEGLAIIELGKGKGISNCKTWFEYNRNPFAVTSNGYSKVYTESDYVNPHGTGTEVNEAAESLVYKDTKQLRYKEKFGHTQGVSGLLEVCCVLSEDLVGSVLCVSSGLGGFYGSCIVNK